MTSLGDKMFDTSYGFEGKLFVKDVKQSIKNILNQDCDCDGCMRWKKRIKEEVGEKLTGENWKEKFVGVKDEN